MLDKGASALAHTTNTILPGPVIWKTDQWACALQAHAYCRWIIQSARRVLGNRCDVMLLQELMQWTGSLLRGSLVGWYGRDCTCSMIRRS